MTGQPSHETVLPPMFGVAPPLSCTRVGCGADATHHIIWTPDMENGLVCDEHLVEARERWTWWAVHAYQPVCSMEGARFLEAENRCVSPNDPVLFAAAAPCTTSPATDRAEGGR